MRKTLILVVVCLTLATSACQSGAKKEGANANSGASPTANTAKGPNAAASSSSPKLTISFGGKETPLEVKSGSYQMSVANYAGGGKSETASEAVFFDLGQRPR
jgi:hypothetical protein